MKILVVMLILCIYNDYYVTLADDYIILMQALAIAQKYGNLSTVSGRDSSLKDLNGWHLVPRIHILLNNTRGWWGEKTHALYNDTNFAAKKNNIGFSSYTKDEVKAITDNLTFGTAENIRLVANFSFLGLRIRFSPIL